MKNWIKHSIISLVVLSTACASHKTVFTAPENNFYTWNPHYGVGASIHFNSDNTFKYEWVTGLIRGGSNGNWHQYNDTIVLNSNRQPLQSIYLNQETRSQQYLSLKIRNYSDSTDLPFIRSKVINGDTIIGGYTDEFGELTFNLTHIDTLNLYSFDFSNHVIVCSPDANHFDIYLVEKTDSHEPYTFFTNSIWIMNETSIFEDSSQRKFELNKRK